MTLLATSFLVGCTKTTVSLQGPVTPTVKQQDFTPQLRQKLQKDSLPEILVISKKQPLTIDLSNHLTPHLQAQTKPIQVNNVVQDQLKLLFKSAEGDGIEDLLLTSGYRDRKYQEKIFNRQIKRHSQDTPEEAYRKASQVVAPPGTSEHESGMAVDFLSSTQYSLTQSFEKTPAGKWLMENAYKFGFILRYPKGKEEITSISYEPWHYRYVGIIHAYYMHHNQMTLEEYTAKLKEDKEIQVAYGGSDYIVKCLTEDKINAEEAKNIDKIKDISLISEKTYVVTLLKS